MCAYVADLSHTMNTKRNFIIKFKTQNYGQVTRVSKVKERL